MGHKSRTEQRRLKSQQKRVDHQTRHKQRSPQPYKRPTKEIEEYIHDLNEDWKGDIDS